MREVLPVHEPLLVNTLGHSAGTVIFAIFVYLLLRDRAGARLRGSRLTLGAAVLALIWNLASLLVIGSDPRSLAAQVLVAISSSALSILPGVLLHISLGARFAWIRIAGYALAVATVGLHVAEVFLGSAELHSSALNLTTFGFGTLTAASIVSMLRAPGNERRLVQRLLATMSLFLFSLSLVHLGESHTHSWPMELVAHHAGIVLALFVLLQDYRFLLLDAFLRFLANILLAAVFVFAAVRARNVLTWADGDPFRDGMVLAACCLLFLLYAFLRSRVDHLFTRLLLARRNVGTALQAIRTYTGSEADLAGWAARLVAEFFDAPAITATPGPAHPPPFAAPVTDLPAPDRDRLERSGVEAILPLRISATETGHILLGRRNGGRRYLSEDFADMQRIQAELIETTKRLREDEMRRLVNQAELRALQSQINPHFLFNVLNTLYGVIPRQAEGARRTVLNLSDIFRYFLNTDRAFIPLEEELQIVRSYLEIEQLRLGSRLRWETDVDPAAARFPIPTLTVQPLVENAVKHGIAPSPEGGMVRLEARLEGESLRIRVSDTGIGFQPQPSSGAGVGLDNVRKRLRLSYGAETELRIDSSDRGAAVEFLLPAAKPEAVIR